jgi:hydrogenase expression/formation protein HypC
MCLAIPGRLLSCEGSDPLLRSGRVSFGGVVKSVQLAYVPDARVGDYLIVHVGFAISILDQLQAQRVLRDLADAGVLTADLNPNLDLDRGSAER